jgi:hypothetical protein
MFLPRGWFTPVLPPTEESTCSHGQGGREMAMGRGAVGWAGGAVQYCSGINLASGSGLVCQAPRVEKTAQQCCSGGLLSCTAGRGSRSSRGGMEAEPRQKQQRAPAP